jgi:glycine oxidase
MIESDSPPPAVTKHVRESQTTSDVLIIGGGIIGLSTAYGLAGRGLQVHVVDQGGFGQEASWAGAGILPPGNPQGARTAEARLRAASAGLWCSLSQELRELTGIDNGYRPCGGLELRFDEPAALKHEIQIWRDELVAVEELSAAAARELEPSLNPELTAAYRLPELAQVRNPRHLKALLAGCAARGVKFSPGTPVTRFERSGEQVTGVRTPAGTLRAGQYLITSGAWSKTLLADAGCELDLEPIRGQIVLLAAQPLPFTHVLQVGSQYLVPRPDARILIGSTEEHAGFDKRNTAAALRELIAFATQLVPQLADAKFERAWSGLRPATADGLPYLGGVPGAENLFVAAGHFRSGLQMSPITGQLLTQVILGETPCVPLDPYACDRHGRP